MFDLKHQSPNFPQVSVLCVFVFRLCKVHREAMRQPNDLQKRLLVCGLKWRRNHHKLLQHSRSVQLQWSQVHPHAHSHAPAAVDCRAVIYAVTLKVAPLTLFWDVGLIHAVNRGSEHVFILMIIYLYI